MNSFQGKKILFIALKFFDYEKEIKQALMRMGAEVDFYDDRPKNTFIYKALIRINRSILKKKIEAYYDTIINITRQKEYDYVFFLKAESISINSLKKLRETQSQAKFILYLWDSIANKNDVKSILQYFDRVLSFDKNDVQKYSFMSFRPLFYLEDYERMRSSQKSRFDISFIGTGHSDRYAIISMIKKDCIQNDISGYFFMYMQSKIMFYYRKIVSKAYRKSKIKDFNFKSLNKKEVLEIITSSKVILDIQHDKQSGLTMRAIEILGAQKKLITTNKEIANYDFYHPNNIQIIDRKNPTISKEFIDLPFKNTEQEIYEKYALNNWLKEIFFAT